MIGAGFAGERIVNDLILFPLHQLLEHGFTVKIAGVTGGNLSRIKRSMIPLAAAKPPSK